MTFGLLFGQDDISFCHKVDTESSHKIQYASRQENLGTMMELISGKNNSRTDVAQTKYFGLQEENFWLRKSSNVPQMEIIGSTGTNNVRGCDIFLHSKDIKFPTLNPCVSPS